MHWPDPADIPAQPGSYTFWDASGRALYVGKATDLRRRLGDYAAGRLHGMMDQVLAEAATVTYVVAMSEAEALWVEASLIASLHPKYNLRAVQPDDLAYVAVTVGDTVPRVLTWRGATRKGVRRFGPHPGSTREVVELVGRLWGLRPCRDSVLAQHQRTGRPCILGETGRCAAPCVDTTGYSDRVTSAVAFLEGRTAAAQEVLEVQMRSASESRRYEQAALLRDRLELVRGYTTERTVADLPGRWAVLGQAADDLGAIVTILHLADGVLTGTETVVVDWPASGPVPNGEQVLAAAWWRLTAPRPPRVLIDGEGGAQMARPRFLLSGAAGADNEGAGGARVTVASTRAQRRAVTVAASTAAAALVQRRRQASGDPAARAAQAAALAASIGLATPPWHIECLDISHFDGEGVVAGLSVLVDGLPRPALYRRWRLPEGNDDYAAMATATARRARHLRGTPGSDGNVTTLPESVELSPTGTVGDGTVGRTAVLDGDAVGLAVPDLLIIDGGPGQLAAATAALESAGVAVPVVALAKRLEELWLPGRDEPIVLERNSPALLLLQRARDEAHRTAVTYQRRIRRRLDAARSDATRLEGIAGLGPKRKARLLEEAGSVKSLEGAAAAELQERFPWLPETVTAAIAERLGTAVAEQVSG